MITYSNSIRKICHIVFGLLLLLSVPSSAVAQNITGKWECTNEMLKELGYGYMSNKGYCKFYADGKFVFSMKGWALRWERSHRTIVIKVKGHYTVNDGCISTTLDDKNIFVYVEPEIDAPWLNEKIVEHEKYRTYDFSQTWWTTITTECDAQEESVRDRLFQFWNMKNAKIDKDRQLLNIGKKIKLKKRKRILGLF